MRKKTETKQHSILAAAQQIFNNLGFERASVSDICAVAKVSKATVYNYFPSKEALFLEVVFYQAKTSVEHACAALSTKPTHPAQELQIFGERLLQALYTREMLEARRMLLGQAQRDHLGLDHMQRSPVFTQTHVREYLQQCKTECPGLNLEPDVAAWHLIALLQAEVFTPCMLGVNSPLDDERIVECVTRAIHVFVKAYDLHSFQIANQSTSTQA